MLDQVHAVLANLAGDVSLFVGVACDPVAVGQDCLQVG
jgi:hypothetical protein